MWLHSDQMFPIDTFIFDILPLNISDIYNRPIFCSQDIVIKEYLVDSGVLVVDEKRFSWMGMVTMAKPEIKIIFYCYIAIWSNQVVVNILNLWKFVVIFCV
jgi:hypothetical protein